MQVHLYDFRWNDPQSFEFQASNGERFGRKMLTQGDDLSIKVVGEVRCAGSRRDLKWQPCPQRVEGRKKCESCRNREGNFVVTSFDGFNTDMFTPEDLARLQGEHVVYLALFDAGLKKVGVSKLERKTLRQVEQGSQHTLYLAQTPDGILARQIETCLRQAGIGDKVQSSTKKDFVCPDITAQAGEAELKETLAPFQNGFEHHPELNKFLLEQPEFIDWSATYGLDQVTQSPKGFHVVKLGIDESVSGKILAAKGPFLMLETPDEVVCICAKDLLGYQLDFTPAQPGLHLASALQNALF